MTDQRVWQNPGAEAALINRVCPACGWRVHHSHARGWREKLIRMVTSYKLYRCRECGWRGWLGRPNFIARKHRLRVILGLLVTLLLTLLLAYYLVEKMAEAPISREQILLPVTFDRLWR
jgi:predicted RNA-binding Zn-ribbon protein involved in translation (DUF1610 family)